MKLSFLILSLAVAATVTYADSDTTTTNLSETYVEVPLSELDTNPLYLELINFGVKYVLEKAKNAGAISDFAFNVNGIYKVSKRTLRTRVYYKFEVDLDNNDGTVMETTFTVEVMNQSGAKKVVSYKYNTIKELDLFGDAENNNAVKTYVDVPLSEIDTNPLLVELMNFGVEYVLEKARTDSDIISNNIFNVTKVNKVLKRVLRTRVYYKFDVELDDSNGTTVNTTFTVELMNETAAKKVVSYKYNAIKKSSSTSNLNTNTGMSNTNNIYIGVPLSEIQTNPLLLQLVNFGTEYVLEKARNAGDISNNVFTVTAIKKVSKRELRTRVYYKFEVELDDSKGTTVNTTFTVEVMNDTAAKKVVAYIYNSIRKTSSIPDSDVEEEEYKAVNPIDYQNPEIQNILEHGIDYVIQKGNNEKKISGKDFFVEKINSIEKKAVSGGESYKFDVELKNEKGNVKVKTTFTILHKINPESNLVMAYKYTVTRTF